MQRRKHTFEGLIMEEDANKIRKTRCSPSSSTSSIIHKHRPKKAALVVKRGAGSSTPVPTWKLLGSRSPSMSLRIAAAETPRSQSGRSQMQPVSARKLAATLWELNELPIPLPKDSRRRRRERVDSLTSLLPPHLSDPSHSSVSERSDRSGTGTHGRYGIRVPDVRVLDSVSNASFMEIETRSRCQSRLKDVSTALTTSKELLKIITRMWVQEDNQPSSSMSLVSALHTELERARLQVNQLVQEKRSDQNEINFLLQCFAEEKAAWKNKEKEAIQIAIESVTKELEIERKLRRRIESLNKKLGKELAETKSSFSNFEDDSVDCDLHSIELNKNRLIGMRGQRRSTSLVRSMSNVVDGDLGFSHRKSCGDDLQRSKAVKAVKGLREHIYSPDLLDVDRSVMIEEVLSRRRQEEARNNSKNARRSRQWVES